MNNKEILAGMSLEDKIALCSGKDFWHTKEMEGYGIQSLMMCDGPHGLRKQEAEADMLGVNESRPATCFPTAVTTAASWNPELMTQIGKTIAEEAKAYDVDIVLGPGANIKRNPLCGRNFEYFSEDPYLAGKMAAGFIRGAEGEGIGCSLKHFACNSREKDRFTSDSVLDERTFREIYLTAFEIAVKEGIPSTVMCAYNKINGSHCSDNRELLTEILREEWGFDGVVMTDWGAMNDRMAAFHAGCDLNMPGGSDFMEAETAQAVRDGKLAEEDIDRSALRMLELIEKCIKARNSATGFDMADHHRMAKKAAEEGIVLLKNQDAILPILGIREGDSDRADMQPGGEKTLALIGKMAEKPRYQGAGSSHINPLKLSKLTDTLPHTLYAAGCDEKGDTTEELLKEAADAAAQCDLAVVCVGLTDKYESEGFDRGNMKMPQGHLDLIEAVAKANPNTVVILMCGSPVECPWADSVKGILFAGLSGQAGAEAIADILTGKVNPSGKLAESWPLQYEDCISSSYYGEGRDALYREGIYVGYRYYDKAGKAVRWPFGYGLSYTDFTYSDLMLEQMSGSRITDPVCRVTCRITNTGAVRGKEVAELYIGAKSNHLHRPMRELKGFAKIELEPGESKELTFELTGRDLSVWDQASHSWKFLKDTYEISVGTGSRDLALKGTAELGEASLGKASLNDKGMETKSSEDSAENIWYDTLSGIPSQEELEAVMGVKYQPIIHKKGSYTIMDTVEDMRKDSLIMKIMYKAVDRTIRKGMGKITEENEAEYRMMMSSSAGSPIRSMMISGGMKGGLLPGMVELANGHFFRGIGKMMGIRK